MRKWLIAFFLLLITSFGVIELLEDNETNGDEVEQSRPSNTEVVR